MYVLFRFDPFDAAERFWERPGPKMLAMDAVRDDDRIHVYFDAPGVSPDDIDLTVEKHAVTVEASRRWYDADQRTLTSERPQGTFRRQIQFGDNVAIDDLEAKLEHGVLQLTVPIDSSSTTRKIDIATSSDERQLEPS